MSFHLTHRRPRRVVTWMALAGAVACVAAWQFSLHYYMFWYHVGPPTFRLDLGKGSFYFWETSKPTQSEWGMFDPPSSTGALTWPAIHLPFYAAVPMWIPAALAGLLVAWLWWPPGPGRGQARTERPRRQRMKYAAVVFVISLAVMSSALNGTAEWSTGWSFQEATRETLSCSKFVAIMLNVSVYVLLAGVLARLAYARFRWAPGAPERVLCESCGYDLHGNVSGRCPECGAACESGGPADSQMGEARVRL